VEADPRAARAARANIAALGAGAAATLTTAKVERVVAARPDHEFDAVFADPPYALADADLAGVLADLDANGWLAAGGVLVVERSTRSPEPTWRRRSHPNVAAGTGSPPFGTVAAVSERSERAIRSGRDGRAERGGHVEGRGSRSESRP
jgi:predicted O-methyltransferase YrrM